MNLILRSLKTSTTSFSGFFLGRAPQVGKNRLYSTCWSCLKSYNGTPKYIASGSNSRTMINHYSTQPTVSTQLAKYLDEEIAAEQEMHRDKLKPIPSQFHGFEVQLNGSEVTLSKETPTEMIEITLNVNHSLQESGEPSEVETAGEGEENDLTSEPPFQIEIKRGDTVLRLLCSYLTDENTEGSEEYGDIFAIEELAIYKGEWNETNYSVSASILDEGVYDMLMGVLDEKGITNECVRDLSELCTSYEHTSYVSLLRDLKKFVS